MGKKDPATIEAPDPLEVARTDAEFNRIDQYTPYGNLTYGGPNRNQATLSLAPELQNIFDKQLQVDDTMVSSALGRLGGLDPNQIDLSQFGGIQSDAGLQRFDPSSLNLPDIPTDMEGYRSKVEDAMFSRGSRLLNPEFARQEESLLGRLANQGLPQGGNAYSREMDIFGDNRNQAYGDLADRSVLAGGQEASRLLANALGARGQMFGEGLQSVGFNNTVGQQGLANQNAARTQGLNEAIGIRGNAFNELAALLGLQQVQTPQMQNFFAPSQVDYMGAQQLGQQANMFNQNASNQMNSAALGGLYGLGGSLLTGAGAAKGFKNLFGGG